MDLKNLKTFLYVAELSSFTRAAEILGYSQPTISFQIRQLEKELDTQLFERINHTVVLTSNGREVMHYAQQITKLAQELEQTLHAPSEITGLVRLATADSLCPMLLGESFSEFRRHYPGIRLKIITAGIEEMFRLLNHNEVDLVLTLDSHIYHAEYIIAHEEKISSHFIVGKEYPLARQGILTVDRILNEPFFLTEKGMSYRRMLDEALAARSMEIIPVLETGNAEQICRLVEANLGLSFLPDYTSSKSVAAGTIDYLQVSDISIDIWKQLLYHRDKWVSPAMQVVIQYCQSV
ncbi:MAG: LysR family transcriptional regulator [Brotaphodocola sp.]